MLKKGLSVIKNIWMLLTKSKARQDLVTLLTGSVLAQSISMALMPIITRLFSPEELGLQSSFLVVAGFFAAIATLSYQSAIVVPDNRQEAIQLVKICLASTAITSVIVGISMLVAASDLLPFWSSKDFDKIFFLLPVSICIFASFNTLQMWTIRQQNHRLISKNSIAGSLLTNLFKIISGWFSPSAWSLIAATLFAKTILTYQLFSHRDSKNSSDSYHQGTTCRTTMETLKSYSHFPRYQMPKNLLNILSQGLPLLLIGTYIGSQYAGYYALAIGVLAVPVKLLGDSLRNILYPIIAQKINQKEVISHELTSITRKLFLLGLPCTIVLIVLSPDLFSFVFGEDWHRSGQYAQALALLFFFQLLIRPAITSVPPLGLQRELLIYEVASTTLRLGSLLTGMLIWNNDLIALWIFSASGSVCYALLVFWIIKKADCYNDK